MLKNYQGMKDKLSKEEKHYKPIFLHWENYKLIQSINVQKRHIKYQKENIKYLYTLKRKCNDSLIELNNLYINSYKKYIVNSKYSIGDLCDYRLELTCKINELNECINILNNKLNQCNKNVIVMINNLCNLEILLNKVN